MPARMHATGWDGLTGPSAAVAAVPMRRLPVPGGAPPLKASGVPLPGESSAWKEEAPAEAPGSS